MRTPMKIYLTIIALLATTSLGLALLVDDFTSWGDLTERSSDLVIARCIATQDGLSPKPAISFANVIGSDIEIISILKGDTKPSLSHMTSLYQPYRGEVFLLFANHYSDQSNLIYRATEAYRIVPLKGFFQTNLLANLLAGKTLKEQVQLVLAHRLKDLNQELAKNNEEKERIEADFQPAVGKTGQQTNESSTVPSKMLQKSGRAF